jgi:SDR family mycofactocin-dependent oxidoreductase
VGRLDGKVALISGAARGQGRSHARRFAEEGADIVALDMCAPVESVPYELASAADLTETVRAVEELDRRVVGIQADVRDPDAVRRAVADGVASLGDVDIVLANAGIASFAPVADMPSQMWRDVIDVNLTGAFNVIQAALTTMRDGGSIVVTASTAAVKSAGNLAHYSAAKHGLIGLMKALSIELGPRRIRANAVLPTTVDTTMVHNDAFCGLFMPGAEAPGREDLAQLLTSFHVLPVPWVEPVDISNACLFLSSDEARYITGAALPVDAGWLVR